MSRIADEVSTYLVGLVGASVTVTLKIQADIPGGAADTVVRIMTENNRTLMCEQAGFEEEEAEGSEQETEKMARRKPRQTTPAGMGRTIWDGVTQATTLTAEEAAVRQRLAECGKANDWTTMQSLFAQRPDLINGARPGGRMWYSALRYAAYAGAPIHVVEYLLALGAWRTLRTVQGERPLDIAQRRGHDHLTSRLTPVYQIPLASDILTPLQEQFHALIRQVAGDLVQEHRLRLPEVEPLLELATPRMSFSVPGMYGGFYYSLEPIRNSALLHSESWCRVVTGSAEYYVVSPVGSLLVAAAFDF